MTIFENLKGFQIEEELNLFCLFSKGRILGALSGSYKEENIDLFKGGKHFCNRAI